MLAPAVLGQGGKVRPAPLGRAPTLGRREAAGLDDGVEFAVITELENIEPPEERLGVAGGDGTINSALEWRFSKEGTCPIGLIPA